MRVKNIVWEDFVNYRKPCMFVCTCFCDWKCCREQGMDICMCQNSPAYGSPIVDVPDEEIVSRYLSNPITSSVVFGGFETLNDAQFPEVMALCRKLREHVQDTIVVYTGYNPDEVREKVDALRELGNVVVKFGRFVPGQPHHLDEVLGVELASPNQYAVAL